MVETPRYAWFIAVVWPDDRGVPTATIFEWDRIAGKIGKHERTVRFGPERPFRELMAKLRYEVVEGQVTDPVTPDGVRIALRRELVPVYVPAAEPVYA